MQSSTAKKIVSVFSLVFGALSIISIFQEKNAEVLSWILSISLIIIGILLLIPSLTKHEKGLMIFALVIYSLFVFSGLIILLFYPVLSLIVFAVVGVPFAFSIVYLVLLKKEKQQDEEEVIDWPVGHSNIGDQPSEDIQSKESLEQKLSSLKNMAEKGLITQEEYEAKKSDLLASYK